MSLTRIPGSFLANNDVTFANGTFTNANLGNLATANFINGTLRTNAQPNITSVGNLANLTVTGNVTAAYIIGNGSQLTGLPESYANSNVASYLPTHTGNISAGNANLGNLTTSNYFTGNGSLLTGITGSNVTGQVGNALVSGTVYTASQPNITSVGTLTSLDVTGNILSGNANLGNAVTADYFIGSGNNLSNIQAANITGTVANATYAGNATTATTSGTVTTASQPNITSVGTLTSLAVTGNITSGNANLGNSVNASYFIGDGSLLTGVSKAIAADTVSNGTSNLSIPAVNGNINISSAGNANILVVTGTGTNVNGTLNVTGNANVGNLGVTTDLLIGGNLIVNGTTTTVNSTTTSVVDPIIELGGGSNGAALSSSDSKDRGQLLHYYSGSAIDAFMGWDSSNAEFAFGSNVSVSSEVVTFNSFGNIRAGNASLGNLASANYVGGNGSLLTSITGGNVTGQVGNALVSGTVYTASQPNITSVGTLTSLSVSGTITPSLGTGSNGIIWPANPGGGAGDVASIKYYAESGESTRLEIKVENDGDDHLYFTAGGSTVVSNDSDASSVSDASFKVLGGVGITKQLHVGSNVTASYFIGNGSLLTSITGANVTGTVANATYAASAGTATTITTAAQPNITSVGTLSSLSVSSNIISGNASLGNLITANYFSGNGSLLAGITGGNVTGQVGNALVSGTVYTAAQPNITSVGTLTSLDVTANITGGNANLGNLVTANFFTGNGNLLTSITGANVTGQVGNALVAGTVYTAAQPNITGVGTLGNLTVSGNIFSSSLVQNASGYDTRVSLNSAAGIAEIITNGNSTKFLPSGQIELSGASQIIGGTFGGSGFTLGSSQTDIFQNRGGNVNIQVGPDGTIAKTWTFAQDGSFTSPGNVNSLNANLGNLLTANFFTGNGSLLTSITGANVSGQVGNALVASTVYTAAQPNITSVGTLSGLTSNGIINFTDTSNVSLGAVGNVKITGGTTGYVLSTDGAGNLSWAAQSGGTGASISNGTSNVNVASSGNITIGVSGNASIVTVTGTGANIAGYADVTGNLNVGAISNLGPIGNVKITGGTSGYVLSTDGSGTLSWVAQSGGGGGSGYTAATTPPGTSNPGDLWYNTSTNVLYEYIFDGTSSYWVDMTTPTTSAATTTTYVTRSYTGDGSTTNYTVTLGCDVNNILVFLNGICQLPTTDYTVSGTVLTLIPAADSGMSIQVRELPR